MVPAVTEVWRPHRTHSWVQGSDSSRQALVPPPGAGEAIGPAQRCEVLGAGNLTAEALLELTERARKVGHFRQLE